MKEKRKLLMRAGFINLVEIGDALWLEPTPEGIEEAKEWVARNETNNGFYEMLEYALTNGWNMVPPEDIDALTSAPIISQDGFISDHGTWYPYPNLRKPAVYAHMSYAVEDPVQEWAEGRPVRFVKAILEWTPGYRKAAREAYSRE